MPWRPSPRPGGRDDQVRCAEAKLLGDLVGDRAVALDRQRIAADRRRGPVRDGPPAERALGVGQERPPHLGIGHGHDPAADRLDRIARPLRHGRVDEAHRPQAGPRRVARQRDALGLVAGGAHRHARVLELRDGERREAVAPAAGRVLALVLDEEAAQAKLRAERLRREERRIALAHGHEPVSPDRELRQVAGHPRPRGLPGAKRRHPAVHGRNVRRSALGRARRTSRRHRDDRVPPTAAEALQSAWHGHPASIPLDADGSNGVYFMGDLLRDTA